MHTEKELRIAVKSYLHVGDVVEIYNANVKGYLPHTVLDFYSHHVSLCDH